MNIKEKHFIFMYSYYIFDKVVKSKFLRCNVVIDY